MRIKAIEGYEALYAISDGKGGKKMSYESPISLIYENAQRQMQIQLENGVYSAVQNVGIDVNKDELIKALQYDRQQYDKGYSDGMWYADHRNKWISVEEAMPEDNVPVNIVWINQEPPSYYQDIKGKPFVATAVHFRGVWHWWDSTIEDRLAEYGESQYTSLDEFIEVTHWMPLPEPPKEGDSE